MNFHKKLNRILEIALIAIMSILVVDVLWQVTSRYILNSPSAFTDELAGFLLIWVGLLGAAYVAGRNEHLAIDLLLQKTRVSRKRNLMIFIQVCILIFAFTAMVIGGSWLVYTRFVLGVKSAALELPLGYVYIVLPLSGLLIVYYSLRSIILLVKDENINISE
jgi:TRAP-type C4-dicarboxylate transport system permease small subunit